VILLCSQDQILPVQCTTGTISLKNCFILITSTAMEPKIQCGIAHTMYKKEHAIIAIMLLHYLVQVSDICAQ
jgi:hypothetical protein